jgi:hypothetical protein
MSHRGYVESNMIAWSMMQAWCEQSVGQIGLSFVMSGFFSKKALSSTVSLFGQVKQTGNQQMQANCMQVVPQDEEQVVSHLE